VQKYVHLFTGQGGDTEVAVYCPTTLYRLGVNLHPTIVASYPLRDLCEYDVLDELLIEDGALTTKRYKALVIFQGEVIDDSTLARFEKFRRGGGKIIVTGQNTIRNVEGKPWRSNGRLTRIAPLSDKQQWPLEMAKQLKGYKGFEGTLDGLWTCRRGSEVFVFNSNDQQAETVLGGEHVTIAPHTIFMKPPGK
jgi:hypothetical protein